MPGSTDPIELSTDDWTLIGSNIENIFIQLLSDGPVMIHVAGAKPDVTNFTGAVLSRQMYHLQALQLVGLVSGTDMVYARGRRSSEIENITVITT